MAESTRRFRNSTSRSIAATSAIALALGGLSVVAPGPLAPYAAAASGFTGGIRDKSGAVEKDAQQASDLPAGSCVVTATNKPDGSQAGFSWNTLEPGSEGDKTLWGLSVSFDNSKDRTFADWYFTNSGQLGDYLNPGEVPSMEAGQTFLGKSVTHKADESIDITASRSQRNLNLYAEMTEEKVGQFASAAADNPVRYAWQGNYKKDNTSGVLHAAQGPNSAFSATVNPWPSENIECNPITVSWENREKLVIRPGEELKVGKINVPQVQNGGTDDSMSRMVVEAYDAQGNFIGTSDTDASGGGKSSVRIDQDTGEVFYTMPEYKGTKLSDQQGMRFSVLAKPRTVDQLQAAARNNVFGGGGVFDSSNSLTRYNQANVIANHQWSLDDTQFHDPAYDPGQQAIISGVENDAPTTERQVIKFKVAGDKITDLVKNREDGGFEAEVKLDKKNVYSGWEAKMDPDTYEVTVTAPLNPNPGTFAQPRVVVTYSNGSRDVIPLLVVVDPNNTQVTTLVSPGTTTGIPGQSMDAQLTWDPAFEDHDPVQPTKYEVDPNTVPEGWTVTVDDKGKVTATSPVDAPNFSTITPEIKAIYPDGTTDTVKTTFQVINSVKVPDYAAVSGQVGEEVSLQPVMPPVGQGGKETDEEPNRYTFEDGTTEYKVGEWTIKIDENTGVLSTTIPDDVFPGAQLTVPVKVHYATGSNPQITTGTISVIGKKSGEDTAHYLPKLTKAGVSVTSDFQSLLPDSKLAKFKLPDRRTWPKGWEFSIDESGTVTATPGSNIPNGEAVSIPVHVVYPDGSTAEVPADFTVVGSYSRINQPTYPTVNGKIGTTVTSHVDRTHLSDASEPRFSLVTDPKDPDYIAPPRNLTWDQVKIDPETGEITTPIGKNVLPGSSADIPVRVTYKDGSKDFTIATVVAQGAQRQIYEPKYEQKTTKPGEGVASSITEDTKIPERDLATEPSKRFSAPDTVEGWTVKVDESGIVTATPPKTAKAGDGIQVPVTVTYLDGSQDTVLAPFKVRESQNDVYEPSYSVQDAAPGEEVKRNVNRNNIPVGSTFSFGMDGDEPKTEDTVDGWEYKIDPATGDVSVTPPADAKPGDRRKYHVSVTYPDGSIDEVPVGTVVKLTNKWEANPTYPEETVYPGETATLPVALDKPENVKVAKENPYKLGDVPTGWNVSIDDNGQVTATAPADAKPGDQVKIPVTVTYEDGSTDTAYAVVNVVDVPTREVPFKVEYKYDDSIPAGEYKVETKGEPGAEKQNKDGTWEQTKAPTNEVVVVGAKPAESAEEVTWTVPIPYPTEVRENPNLKPGETRVVQEGENGEKTYTAKFTAKGDKAEVVEEETTKEPVKRIVEYGPGLAPSELVTKTEKPIPFETTVEFDPNLPAGEKVVDQKGELGTEVETSTQKLVDGKPSGDPTVTTERTKEPTTEKIRVGTKTTGETTKTVESEVPFGVKIEYDPNMSAGESEVTTPGKPGKKTTTVTQNMTNSQPDGEATVEEKITEEPVDQVIKVGTKPSETSEKVEWKAPVPFEVETRPNPELKPGEIKVVQKGEPGEKTYTANFASKGDESSVTPEEKQTKDPVKEIIEYGPTAADQTLTSTKTREVAFETEIVFDDTLPAGEQVVDQQGEKGEELITSTQEIKDGKPSGDPTITIEETKAPKKAIIRVGTKQVDPEEPAPAPSPSVEPLTVELPYPVEYTFDPNLPAGEEVVDQEGTPGSKTLRPKLEMVDGKPVWTIEEVETHKPVQRVVRVGTKQPETSPFTWTSEVPFNTTVKPNPELAPGESRVVQVGENGSTKYSADPTTGEVTKLEEKKPVEHIVEYGPKDNYAVTKVTRLVPFETEVIYDPDLSEGAQRIEQGEVGEEVVTTTQDFKDGELVGEPTTNTERTREPKNAVIRIGTKKTPNNASVTELEVPPTTQLIFDPSLAPGEQVVVREGTPGTVRVTTVDGETTVENTLDAIPRLVRVGAKQPDQLNRLEPLPFKVITRENPDLPAGEHKVIQEGKPGLVQHVGDTATTVTEAQDYILEIGTAKDLQEKREVITEPIPFETIIVEDDTLAAGVVKVDTQGENGAKRTTKVWEMKEGKELGDPTVTDETLREPTNLVIRVGTGKPVDPKPEDPKPADPKPEDEKGSSAERCVANAFAANSPLLWLLPIGLLGAIGYGVNEMYGPQINQASGALNARWEAFVRENTSDFGRGGREKPEWMREAEAQANALNQQFNQRFAGYGEQLRPVGIALGALAAVALTGTLIAQACSEEGFDNGMTVLGSTERKLDFGASSEKSDGAQAGSSSETGSSRKDGSSAK